MTIRTGTQIKTAIKAYHGNRTDRDSELDEIVDLAQMRIARLHDWDNLDFTIRFSNTITASAQDDKTLDISPAALGQTGYRLKTLYSVRILTDDGRSHKLDGLPLSEFDAKIPEPEFHARRLPNIYTRFSSIISSAVVPTTIEVYPVPDIVYNWEVREQVWPRFISTGDLAEANVLDLAEVDDLVINLGVSLLYERLGREDKATRYFNIYRAIAKEALDQDEKDYHTTIAGVRVDQGVLHQYWDDPLVRSVR